MDATAPPRTSTTPAAPAVAAAAALTLGVTQILHAQTVPFASPADYVIEGAYALYLVAAVAAVLALRRVHRALRHVHRPAGGWGRIGDAGALLYGLGHALVAVPVTTTFLLGHDAPDPLGALFVPGIALWMAGLVPLAIACFRHGPVPPSRGGRPARDAAADDGARRGGPPGRSPDLGRPWGVDR
ncbi:hypothetical protein [Microbispora triticiradicis]|uniref:Uncharacterized protein n=2 Tax=Microbispora TaxID=2005 RepID=A0ABY3LSV8_9ACTN|nr:MULTISPECIES: hypothetical protein [Microbispora]TLP63767.1 hypothetical protein FED44_05815 [Microbispora fusca]TYB52551.1 hypothetical protein FXF59_24505 [Microbispora tritici]